jgi:hypothetical protein
MSAARTCVQYKRTYVEANAGAGARAGPHACEDCGGDPLCRRRCRVETVAYCDVFYADNAHEFPRGICVLVFQVGFEIRFIFAHVYVLAIRAITLTRPHPLYVQCAW